jgi:PKD repeat protein
MRQALTTVVAAIVLAAAAGCGTSQTTVPSPTGPSTYALSLEVTATPDSVTIDGGSQSAVIVQARNAAGRPQVGLPIRLDIAVEGTFQDCGTLSARSIVTGTDGRAAAVYTAPSAPPPFPQCLNLSDVVTIVATPSGSNADTTRTRSATIRLKPAGQILPPAGSPSALAFTVTPAAPSANSAAVFDASNSTPGVGATQITAYAWTFGDGGSASGRVVSHAFANVGTYAVTLTVTNDRGLSDSTTQAVTVNPPTPPVAAFTSAPPAPALNGGASVTVSFDAGSSTSSSTGGITNYRWNFGDGTPVVNTTLESISHPYTTAGTWTVTLIVTDANGSATTSGTVTVGP